MPVESSTSTKPTVSTQPSSLPSVSHYPSASSEPPSLPSVTLKQTLSTPPSSSPSVSQMPSHGPTTKYEFQNNLVTCVSVIDENFPLQDIDVKWEELRKVYQNRGFCLLRPVPIGDDLTLPSTYFDDPLNIYSEMTRQDADYSDTSDWYTICNLDASKQRGLTNIILWLDNSGSMVTQNVMKAY